MVFALWALKTYAVMLTKFGPSTGVRWCRFFPQLSDTLRIIKATMDDGYAIPIMPALVNYYGKALPPVTGMWLFGTPSLVFNRVVALDEIYVTKNKFHTKHENERIYSAPLLYNNIVSMDTADPQYKKKRKVLSGAFFKNKIRAMMHIVKSTSLTLFKSIQDSAVDGKSEQDLVKLTSKLQNHIITNVLLGEGESFKKLEFVHPDGHTEMVELADFIDLVFELFTKRIQDNIFVVLAPTLFQYSITKSDAAFFTNCETMRTEIRKICQRRKDGIAGGLAVGEEKDIISILVWDENYTNIEDVVDDVIVMFVAGTKTVQGTTTNFLGHYVNRPEFREKLHAEIDPIVNKVKHDFVNAYAFEMTEDLEYTK